MKRKMLIIERKMLSDAHCLKGEKKEDRYE
jgi:hypothetical protein